MKKLTFGLFALMIPAFAADISALHRQVLYTQVRVRTDKAGGSGTVVWSQKAGDFYSTYVLTCHHVIDSALMVTTEWDSLLQRDRKQEKRSPVMVEFFNWAGVPHGKPPLTIGSLADIVAYNAKHDMALLHLKLAQPPIVAQSLSPGRIKEVVIGTSAVAVGCALLHDPILTTGIVTHQGDIIDYADYWMSNAQIIFGNSGGGMFVQLADNYFFVGIPSRVAVTGWSNAVTHLGYFSPINRIYDFYREQVFDFLTPGSLRTEAQCAADRDAKRKLEDRKQLSLPLPTQAKLEKEPEL